jgi:hypothetical protein
VLLALLLADQFAAEQILPEACYNTTNEWEGEWGEV